MESWLGKNRFGVAIVRVSSFKQEGNTSHATQRAEIEAYCAEKGIKLVKVFEIIESAFMGAVRKKYNEALAFALAQPARHLLFYMSDREARNHTDMERNEKLIKAGALVVHYVRERKVLHEHAPDSDFFTREIETAASKHYSRTLGTKISDAQKKKAEAGIFPSNHPPLGYIQRRQVDEDGKPVRGTSRLVPDPKTMPIVQREFELRAEGFSFREIRDRIVKEGLLPAKLVKNYWHSKVEYRIKNPIYAGRFEWMGEWYDGKHELIIPRDTYRKAVSTLGFRKLITAPKGEEGGHFAGAWIRCAECGCVVTYERKTKTYRSGKLGTFHLYHCTNGKREHASMAGRIVAEQVLWAQFDHAMDRLSLSPELAERLARALNQSEGISEERIKRDIAAQKTAIRESEAREETLYDDLTAGILDRETYTRLREKARAARDDAKAKAAELDAHRKSRTQQTAESIIELSMSAKSIYLSRTLPERRTFLETFLSNPKLRGITLEYDYKKPFQSIVSFRESSNWCAQLDEFRTACLIYRAEIPWKIE